MNTYLNHQSDQFELIQDWFR